MPSHGARLKPVVWIIDREQWPRACLRAELIARDFEAVGFDDPMQALAALARADAARPEVVVVERRGMEIERSALDSLARSGAALVALGGSIELRTEAIRTFAWAAVMRRPFSVGDVAEAVARLTRASW